MWFEASCWGSITNTVSPTSPLSPRIHKEAFVGDHSVQTLKALFQYFAPEKVHYLTGQRVSSMKYAKDLAECRQKRGFVWQHYLDVRLLYWGFGQYEFEAIRLFTETGLIIQEACSSKQTYATLRGFHSAFVVLETRLMNHMTHSSFLFLVTLTETLWLN